jgi:hypothetical protein
MTTTFAELVDEVRHRTPEEQDELRRILEQARIDARRAEIVQHARDSVAEEASGTLDFTSDTTALLSRLQSA